VELTDERRQRAIALLQAQHSFPGPFEFRVVTRPGGKGLVLQALLAGAGGVGRLVDVSERASCAGTYVSLRVRVNLDRAEHVLDVYEVLKNVEQVVTVL
jgi:putative lipoic acid-binding regulatory protein